MTGWIIAAALLAALAVAVWANVALADQNRHLRGLLELSTQAQRAARAAARRREVSGG